MRLIDADVLEKQIEKAIYLQVTMSRMLEIYDDESVQSELKAYRDILNGVKEQPTVTYDIGKPVACKDCRDYLDIKCPCYELSKSGDWFCADGKRKE